MSLKGRGRIADDHARPGDSSVKQDANDLGDASPLNGIKVLDLI